MRFIKDTKVSRDDVSIDESQIGDYLCEGKCFSFPSSLPSVALFQPQGCRLLCTLKAAVVILTSVVVVWTVGDCVMRHCVLAVTRPRLSLTYPAQGTI